MGLAEMSFFQHTTSKNVHCDWNGAAFIDSLLEGFKLI